MSNQPENGESDNDVTEQSQEQNIANNINNQHEHIHQEDYVYDKINQKENSTLRLLYININGLPQLTHHPKNKQLLDSLKQLEVDIFGLTF